MLKKEARALIVASLVLGLLVPSLLLAENSSVCKVATSMLSEASSIRNLNQLNKVPCLVHDKKQVRKYLEYSVNENFPKDRLKGEEYVFKAVGLLPEDYDYKEGIISIYLREIAGYYDPEKEHFVMASWMPSPAQVPIAVHELTHALQDQHFDLEAYMDFEKYTTDELFARAAVVEGDASAVMFDYFRRSMRQIPLRDSANVNDLKVLLGATESDHPKSMMQMMVFPYAEGLQFVHELIKRGGYPEVDKAFKQPPRSTEEVLHPEKYFEKQVHFRAVSEADLLKGLAKGNWKVSYSDVLGEFSILALMRMFYADSKLITRVATGWAGDRIGILDSKDGERRVIWKTLWDTDLDAKEFLEAYSRALKSDTGHVSKSTPLLDRSRALNISKEGTSVTLVVKYTRRN